MRRLDHLRTQHTAPPPTLAARIQGQWSIDALHWLRDVTFDEDRSIAELRSEAMM